jgi:hypothetical protein
MATSNREMNPQVQLTLFEEASRPVEMQLPTEAPLASPSVAETDSRTEAESSVQEDEVLTDEQEKDLDRLLDMGGFTRAIALGRVGVKRNVEERPVQPKRPPAKPKTARRRYVPRNDPDYQAGPWNER